MVGTFRTRPSTTAHSLGEVRYIGTASTGRRHRTGKKSRWTAGETLACSFLLPRQRLAVPRLRPAAVLRRQRRADRHALDGLVRRHPHHLGQPRSSPAPEVVVVPTGAFQACWRWVVDRTQTTRGPTVRFFAPVVRRQGRARSRSPMARSPRRRSNVTDLGAIVATLGTCTITSALNFVAGRRHHRGNRAERRHRRWGRGLRTSVLTLTLEDTWYDICQLHRERGRRPRGGAAELAASSLARRLEWNISLATTYKGSRASSPTACCAARPWCTLACATCSSTPARAPATRPTSCRR